MLYSVLKTLLINFTHSNIQVSLNNHNLILGSPNARNKISFFYSAECGFSKEFFNEDIPPLINLISKRKDIVIELIPAALDVQTIRFAYLAKVSQVDWEQKNNTINKNTEYKKPEKLFYTGMAGMYIYSNFHSLYTQIRSNTRLIKETPTILINNKPVKCIPSYANILDYLNLNETSSI